MCPTVSHDLTSTCRTAFFSHDGSSGVCCYLAVEGCCGDGVGGFSDDFVRILILLLKRGASLLPRVENLEGQPARIILSRAAYGTADAPIATLGSSYLAHRSSSF